MSVCPTNTAGTLGGSIHLELSYRYTDAGEIRTDVGDIAIVRYREDGTRRDIPVRIDETSADCPISLLTTRDKLQRATQRAGASFGRR